jgi:hypothetical protein
MYVREGIIMKSHITCYINNPDFYRTANGNSSSCLFTEHGEQKTDVIKNVAESTEFQIVSIKGPIHASTTQTFNAMCNARDQRQSPHSPPTPCEATSFAPP